MEEKKSIKVSLATVICIIIIFLLIMAIAGIYIYYNYIADSSKTERQNKVVNNNTINNSDAQLNPDTTLKLNNEEAKRIIEKFLYINESYTGSPLELCLFDTELELKVDYSAKTSDGYVSTGIKYDNFKNVMLKYMTEELFNNFDMYKNIDGTLYAFNGGASGIGHSDIELTLLSKTNNEYTYSVTCLVYPPENGEKESYTCIISYVNEKYVVSSYK